ncbi:MAG: DUF342 domain-containing protein [Desulfamplus sp.]|nr:DUF342 domain-containing protein [Desulfamplus sp.]MBF0388555.1 DUF342 domain-containing protein [Desulfamplus sp.]
MAERNTILIVDDQESIIKSLKRLLLPEPYQILSATDGESALEFIKEHNKDNQQEGLSSIFLIISDQRMPNMTGTQFLEKSVELLPNAIRFILSGYADREDIITSLNQGIAHRYLTKPWNNDELLIMVRQAYESPERLKAVVESYNPASKLPEINIMDKEIKKFDEHRKDMFLGKAAVHHGFINQEQLESSITAMQSERQAGRNVSLENILFEKGFISSEDMGKIVAATKRRMGKNFAKAAMRDFGVSLEDIERCLAIQSQEFKDTTTCRVLDDILVAENIITEEQKESIIIDQIYSERELVSSNSTVDYQPISDNEQDDSISDNTDDNVAIARSYDLELPVDVRSRAKDDLILKRRKKKFFRQRALDKIFCKAAINRNFATEPEVLKALEVQMLHFTKTFEIKQIKDILTERSIISQEQAQTIVNALSQTQQERNLQTKQQEEEAAAEKNKEKDEAATSEKESTSSIEQIHSKSSDAFEVTISSDQLEAKIRLVGDMPEDMTAIRLKELVASTYQISYGFADDTAIELFLKQAPTKKESFVIAKGKPLKLGRNALIKYFFEDQNKIFGKELASGKFDYRDRGETPNVMQGALLAEKIPIIPSFNGITVRGTEIIAPIPTDANLDCGQGVGLSKDGLRAIAIVNGRPDLAVNGKISILPEKVIKGNVDFRTGNIKFSGDIVITGTILSGFSVTGANLTVNDIEEAEVNITNSVSVKNNINASTVKTGLLLTAQTISRSTIIAQGDVVVQKEIIDSTIITSGMVIVPRGRIIASTIHAAKGIEAMNIGSEVSTPCQLFPVSDEHANSVIKSLLDNIAKHEDHLSKLEAVEKQYDNQSVHQLNELSELSRLQERLIVERQKIINDKQGVSSEIVKKQMDEFLAELDKRALKMDQTINKLFDENDVLVTKNSEVKVKIKSVKSERLNLVNEKNRFEKWYAEQKADISEEPGVSAQSTIFAGTQITGSKCSIRVKNHIKNSKIQQVINTKDPNNPFHEMAILPLTSRGKQPHVFRK